MRLQASGRKENDRHRESGEVAGSATSRPIAFNQRTLHPPSPIAECGVDLGATLDAGPNRAFSLAKNRTLPRSGRAIACIVHGRAFISILYVQLSVNVRLFDTKSHDALARMGGYLPCRGA